MKKDLTSFGKIISTPVRAGFPNPAEDAKGVALDLNDLIVKNPVSTFYVRVEGDSMQGAGINSGDIVVIDKSIEPRNGDIVIAAVDGEFTLKYLKIENKTKAWLVAAHPDFAPIALHEATDAGVWGVVTYVIHKTKV